MFIFIFDAGLCSSAVSHHKHFHTAEKLSTGDIVTATSRMTPFASPAAAGTLRIIALELVTVIEQVRVLTTRDG